MLAGLVVIILTLWAWMLFNRLWQGSLRNEAEGARAALEARGWRSVPAGLRARVAMEGELDGHAARLEWHGGVRGARSRLRAGDTSRWLDNVQTAEQVEALLGGQVG